MLSVLHVEFMSSAESVWYVGLSVMLGIFVEKEFQLISSYFDLPGNEKLASA